MDRTLSEGTSLYESKKKTQKNRYLRVLSRNLFITLVIVSVAVGIGVGLGLRRVWTDEEYQKIFYLQFPGRLLLNMLQMLILPLVTSSLVTGLASVDTSTSGKLGAATAAYYMTTTLIAVIIGIVLATSFQPGSDDDVSRLRGLGPMFESEPVESILDLISQFFPENLVSACFERVVTENVLVKSAPKVNLTDNTTFVALLMKPTLVTKSGTNVLGIVVISITLGCVINKLGAEARPLKAFFRSVNSVTMVVVSIVLWYTPIGIVFLVAAEFISTKDMVGTLQDLGEYVGVVIGGLAVHGFIVLPLILFFCTRRNPVVFAMNVSKALLTAWGTASSSATLPVTMECLIKKNKIQANLVRFVVPIGSTINLDGTALYEAVACIFIAQVNGMSLDIVDVIVISLTATAAAIGAAGVPQAGLVTMVIALTSVGLPTEDITLILSVDWFLDRFRTVINVWGDCVGAGVLNHFFKHLLPEEGADPALCLEAIADSLEDTYLSYLDLETAELRTKRLESGVMNTISKAEDIGSEST